ncbi:hypothetical protein PQO03_15800 [Lentisphaera profundi]|uniref:Uncharacterized protein n=1 Tax=Lentisphaera profundi TaxID=1658616 RepID=A0ABY7VYQ2_9BACT|nr:hypothetical protein [Lentisphaera profundi]WDE99300.1 hypothetical protein PQO03_15800 [Lentisphaera profundi]
MKKFNLIAAAKISIVDSYENANILIFKNADFGFSGLCVQGSLISPLFQGKTEREPYDSCREWFSEHQDGFLDVETLKLDDTQVLRALERSEDTLKNS